MLWSQCPIVSETWNCFTPVCITGYDLVVYNEVNTSVVTACHIVFTCTMYRGILLSIRLLKYISSTWISRSFTNFELSAGWPELRSGKFREFNYWEIQWKICISKSLIKTLVWKCIFVSCKFFLFTYLFIFNWTN